MGPVLPKFMVWLFMPMLDKDLSRKMISRNVGHKLVIDNSKSIQQLGMTYRTHSESMTEFFQQMIDSGFLEKK